MRQVRHAQQDVLALPLDPLELGVERLDLVGLAPARLEQGGHVLAGALRLGDRFPRLVALELQRLDAGQDLPARLIELSQRGEGRLETGPAGEEALPGRLEVVAEESGVEHVCILVDGPAAGPLGKAPPLHYPCPVNATVRKAVFPAAGLGTRFLPATKAQPKEMLPLVDKPTIQYGVEEALASGVDNVILVTGRGKNAIEDHFDVNMELEAFLEKKGKFDQLEAVRSVSNLINFAYVRQGEPLGLGHAVLVTRALVGDEPFAVILGDDVIDADPPALKQMMNVFDLVQGPVLAVERVPRSEISSYGVIDAEPLGKDVMGGRVYKVKDLVEKPPVEEAPSDLAIIGRYILTPDIFETLETTERDKGGEIQLTNGLRALLKRRPIFAYEIDGVRHDTGNKLGFLKAMVYFALKRPELAEPFKAYLAKMGTPVGK